MEGNTVQDLEFGGLPYAIPGNIIFVLGKTLLSTITGNRLSWVHTTVCRSVCRRIRKRVAGARDHEEGDLGS